MARKVSSIHEVNDTKETWKIAIRITNIWCVQRSEKAGYIQMIFMDGKDCYCATMGRIEKVFAGNGWSYEACSKCNKTSDTSDILASCGQHNSKIVSRFRIQINVSHKEGTSKFILWDRECIQLLNQTADQLKKQLKDEGELNPYSVPEAIDNLLGKTLAFKIRAQPSRSSVIQVSEDAKIIESILQKIPNHEDVVSTEKVKLEHSLLKQDESYDSQTLSATSDYDPDLVGMSTPAKRVSFDIQVDDLAFQDLTSGQLSSTKPTKQIKIE